LKTAQPQVTTDLGTTSLHRITQWPLESEVEILRQYPAFKFGVTNSVRYYAQLLLPVAKSLITSDPKYNDWILTGPALAAQTPAGANLLCRELFELYTQEQDSSTRLSLVDIQYYNESTAAIDYAKLDYADRVRERERLGQQLVPNPDFSGRSILFVNDICVSGAQQQAMQQYFKLNEAARVSWLYLVVVDPEIGRANPKIEWHINFAPFEDLLRMVSSEQIQFTGKCILRLMHLSLEELDQVLQSLNHERRTQLLELALLNGFQDLAGFDQQMQLVRSYSQNRNAVASGDQHHKPST
jgi:hypothetical protein